MAPLFEATRLPFAGYLLDDTRAFVHTHVSTALDEPKACVAAFDQVEPWVFWNEPFLQRRLDGYVRATVPEASAARRDLERFHAAEGVPFTKGFQEPQGRRLPSP